MLNMTSSEEKGICIIHVAGKVDSANANEFGQRLEELDTAERLVLDLGGVEYISSAGLRVILRCRKRHADLEVRNLSSEVYEVFDMTGFTEMMKVSRAYRRVSVEGCEVIGQGANGEIYRIDPDTVVKVYKNADALPEIEHERDVARKALVLGIPTAISYDVVRVGDHYASMFELLNAKSFSNLLAEDANSLEKYARQYIDLLKLIHSTRVPAGQLPDQLDVAIGWIDYLKEELPAETFGKLRDMIAAIPRDDHMIHGDYHTKNLMLQNGEVILIDMDTLAVGHPVLEMASMYNAYVGFDILTPEKMKDFLGIDADTARRFWKRSLELYYGTQDETVLQLWEDRAKTIGLVRILRRCVKRHRNPELADYCRRELVTMAQRIDELT